MRVISVKPANPCFSITWRLTTRCNYDCMYCPTKWHDTNSRILTLDQLKSYWRIIYEKSHHLNLPYKLAISGGEVTTNRDFLPFLEWLRSEHQDKIQQILITTNGSATEKYYQRMFKVVDNISFSVHSEHIDEQRFFDMIVNLAHSIDNTKFLHVNIMNEFWNQDRIKGYQKILERHEISYNVNKIDYSLATRAQPVLKGQHNLEI